MWNALLWNPLLLLLVGLAAALVWAVVLVASLIRCLVRRLNRIGRVPSPVTLSPTDARRSLALGTATLLVLALTAAVSGPYRLLCFWQQRADLQHELFIVNADGSGRSRLTHTGAGVPALFLSSASKPGDAVWSPDGSRLAGESVDSKGDSCIVLLTLSGQGTQTIARGYTWGSFPSWSPDGRRLLFGLDGGAGIWSADTNSATRLGEADYRISYQSNFCWSRDGRKLAFVGTVGDQFGICVINSDGTDPVCIASQDGDSSPTWSPDGRKIAFKSATLHGGNTAYDLFVMNADGSGRTRLTDTRGDERSPAWSPDGSLITYLSDSGLKVTHPDGGHSRLLAAANPSLETREQASQWSPDGSRLAFLNNAWPGCSSLSVVRADGTGLLRLAKDWTQAGPPSWAPDSRRLVCSLAPWQDLTKAKAETVLGLLTFAVYVTLGPLALLFGLRSRPLPSLRLPAAVGITAGVLSALAFAAYLLTNLGFFLPLSGS